MESSAGWRRRQRPLRNLCLFASLRRSRAMMEAQHQRLAATLSAAPAPPPLPPIPVLTPAPQEQQQQQYSKHSPAAEEEPAEHHYQGSQEEKSDSPPPTHDNKRHKPRQEGDHTSPPPFLFSMPLSCTAASSPSFHHHQHRSHPHSHHHHHHSHLQPETQYSAHAAGGACISMPSQLPTFSLDSQCCDISAGGGGGGDGHGHLLLLPATGTQASSSLPPPQGEGQQQGLKSTRMKREEEKEDEDDDDFVPTTYTSRIATSELFPGSRELAAVHAKLRGELVHLKAHGQEGSHRYVMQEMALRVLERKEVEYIVLPREEGGEEGKKRGGGRKRSSNTQQLGYALEELQKGVLAPVGLDPRRTRFLGVASDILADISLVVQGHGGEQEQEMGAW